MTTNKDLELEEFLLDWGKQNKAFQKNDGFRKKLAKAISEHYVRRNRVK